MGIHNLDLMLSPKSVLLLGRPNGPGSVAGLLSESLAAGDFAGSIIKVENRVSDSLEEDLARGLEGAEYSPDLALASVPAADIPQTALALAGAGLKGVVFFRQPGDLDPSWPQAGEEAARAVKGTGLRILGPGGMGIIRPGLGLNAGLLSELPPAGGVALVAQGGAAFSAAVDHARRENIGFSHLVGLGPTGEVDAGDLVDHLGGDHRVRSILLILRDIVQARKFMSAARSVCRIKPVVVLRYGRSRPGREAGPAGEDDVYSAAFERAGMVRVDTLAELYDVAELMGKEPRPRGSHIVVVSGWNETGLMAADALERSRIPLADLDNPVIGPLSETEREALDNSLPGASHSNPVIMGPLAPPEAYLKAAKTLLNTRGIYGVLVAVSPAPGSDPAGVAQALAQGLKNRTRPLLAAWMGGARAEEGRRVLRDAGVPVYPTPEEAVRAFSILQSYAKRLEMLQEVPHEYCKALTYDTESAGRVLSECAVGFGRRVMGHEEAQCLLTAYGLPLAEARSAAGRMEAAGLAEEMGAPVLMRLPGTREGSSGRMEVSCLGEVGRAYDLLTAGSGPGAQVLVSPLYLRPDLELRLGYFTDPRFGPVIHFGMGGRLAGVYRDQALGLPPMNRLLARRLMEKTRVHNLLENPDHSLTPVGERVREMIIRLSHLAETLPQVREVLLEPITVVEGEVSIGEARVLMEPAEVSGHSHLVISPYPVDWERTVMTSRGKELHLRPLMPDDAPLVLELFGVLSPRSIQMRFFSAMRQLPPEMLAKFTQVDYDREVALAAIERENGRDRLMGMARAVGDPDGSEAEFAVLVGDPWQGQGIGAALLEGILTIARQRGFRRIVGTVLKENTGMLALAKKEGFVIRLDREAGEYSLLLNFAPPASAGA